MILSYPAIQIRCITFPLRYLMCIFICAYPVVVSVHFQPDIHLRYIMFPLRCLMWIFICAYPVVVSVHFQLNIHLRCITFPLRCLMWVFICAYPAIVSVHFQLNIHVRCITFPLRCLMWIFICAYRAVVFVLSLLRGKRLRQENTLLSIKFSYRKEVECVKSHSTDLSIIAFPSLYWVVVLETHCVYCTRLEYSQNKCTEIVIRNPLTKSARTGRYLGKF